MGGPVIDASQVACVIPTRGNVDLDPVLSGLPFEEIGVWDNSTGEDLGVYGRYAAIEHVAAPVIFTQDDDSMLPVESVEALLAAYEPGVVVCNVPARFRNRYTDSGLVGFGAIFDRELPEQAFDRYRSFEKWSWTIEAFPRACDLVFTMLTPMRQVDVPYTDREFASDESRMWRQPGHFEERDRMRDLCRRIRAGVAA